MCCCLHNEMLHMMELQSTLYHVLCGLANQTDGMWLLDGCDDLQVLIEMENDGTEQYKHALAIQQANNVDHMQSI